MPTGPMPADREAPEAPEPVREPFRLGINYWPSRTAMGWWQDFDAAETAGDLELMAERGFDSVRFFLTWDVFQPAPDRVDVAMLDRLVMVADLAERAGMAIMPTLFTGHMSGLNLVPDWALGGSDRDPRFRVLAGGRLSGEPLRNWYTDPVGARRRRRGSPARPPPPWQATRRCGRGTWATRTPTACALRTARLPGTG